MAVKLNAEASQFKREMDAAAQSVKALASESKLADAELRKTGDTQTYVEQKTAALTRQIEQQRRAVEAAERLQALANRQYGEGSQEAQQYTAALNRQKAALANLQADLQQVTAGTDRMQASMRSGGDATAALGRIADNTKFTAFKGALDSVSQKMDAVAQRARQTASQIWNMATDSAKWADDLATNASRYGIDTQTLQQWQYASNFVDVEASTIAAASNRVLTAIRNDSEALTNLGVNTRTAAGTMRDTQDVFWETVEALGRMTNETERDAAAQEIFGRSFADLLPLVEAGRDAWRSYCEEAERAGYVLSEDQISRLTSFDDSIQRMRASITSLKHGLMAELAPGFEAISETVTEAVDSLIQWTRTAEGQEAIHSLTEAIQALIRSLANGGLQALITGITDAITALGHAADWAAEHADSLVPLLGLAIGGNYVGRGVINGIQTVSAIRNLFGGAGAVAGGHGLLAGGGAAATGGATTAAGGAAATGGGITAGSIIVPAVGFVGGIAAVSGVGLAARAMGEAHRSETGAEARRRIAEERGYSYETPQYTDAQIAYFRTQRQAQEAQRAAQEESRRTGIVEDILNEMHLIREDTGEQTTLAEWRAREEGSNWAEGITAEDITAAIESAHLSWSSSETSETTHEPTRAELGIGNAASAWEVVSHDGRIDLLEGPAFFEEWGRQWAEGMGGVGATAAERAGDNTPGGASAGLEATAARLAEIKSELDGIMSEWAQQLAQGIAVQISPEMQAYIDGLMAEARELTHTAGWYETDEFKQGEGAYALAMQGYDLEHTIPDAVAHVGRVYEHELAMIEQDITSKATEAQRARNARSQAFDAVEQADNEEERAAAQAAYEEAERVYQSAQAEYDAAVAGREAAEAQAEQNRLNQLAGLADQGVIAMGYHGELLTPPRETSESGSTDHTPRALMWLRAAMAEGATLPPGWLFPGEVPSLPSSQWLDEEGNPIFPQHATPESRWTEGSDSVAAALLARYGSWDAFLAESRDAQGNYVPDWAAAMVQMQNGTSEGRLFYDTMMAAFGDDFRSFAGQNGIGVFNSHYSSDPYWQMLNGTGTGYNPDTALSGFLTRFLGGNGGIWQTAAEANDAAVQAAVATYEAMEQAMGTPSSEPETHTDPALEANATNAATWLGNFLTALGGEEGNTPNIFRYSSGPAANLWNQRHGASPAYGAIFTDQHLEEDAEAAGEQASQGLANGITARSSVVVGAAHDLAMAVKAEIQSALDIRSPSHVMEELGHFIPAGLAKGITGSMSQVTAAVAGMAQAVSAPAQYIQGGRGGNSYSTSSAIYVDTYNQNSAEDIGYINSQLSDLQQRQLAGFGYRG